MKRDDPVCLYQREHDLRGLHEKPLPTLHLKDHIRSGPVYRTGLLRELYRFCGSPGRPRSEVGGCGRAGAMRLGRCGEVGNRIRNRIGIGIGLARG